MLDKSRVIEILVSGVVMPGWTLLMQGAIAYILQGVSDSPCRGERFALDKGVSDSPWGSECIALVFCNNNNLSSWSQIYLWVVQKFKNLLKSESFILKSYQIIWSNSKNWNKKNMKRDVRQKLQIIEPI